MALPKQWLYWAEKAGLRPEHGRGLRAGVTLVGRGATGGLMCMEPSNALAHGPGSIVGRTVVAPSSLPSLAPKRPSWPP